MFFFLFECPSVASKHAHSHTERGPFCSTCKQRVRHTHTDGDRDFNSKNISDDDDYVVLWISNDRGHSGFLRPQTNSHPPKKNQNVWENLFFIEPRVGLGTESEGAPPSTMTMPMLPMPPWPTAAADTAPIKVIICSNSTMKMSISIVSIDHRFLGSA